MVLWFYGCIICGFTIFVVLWFYGVMLLCFSGFLVLWCYGFLFYGFMVLWFYSCMVLLFYGLLVSRFRKLPNFYFMLSGRYWSRIQDFRDLLDGSSGFPGAHLFEIWHFWVSKISRYAKLLCLKMCPYFLYLLKHFYLKKGVERSTFGESLEVPKMSQQILQSIRKPKLAIME